MAIAGIRVTATTRDKSTATEIAVYAIPDGKLGHPSTPRAILQSYVDVVLQGYLRVFGEAGARTFVDTTTGWDVPFVLDRSDPIYPRAQPLSPSERRFVDALLDGLPVRPVARDHLRP